MINTDFKNLIFAEMSLVGKAIADPTRVQLIELLCQCPKNVETLSKSIDSSMATTSHHLQILKQSNLAIAKKDGKFIYYEATQFCQELWICLSKFTQTHFSGVKTIINEFFDPEENLEELGYKEIQKLVKNNKIVLIDVRPTDEYEKEHFPGALSIPLKSLQNKINTLPTNIKIVAYCRGPFCVLSKDAVQILRKKGFQAYRIKKSLKELKTRTK